MKINYQSILITDGSEVRIGENIFEVIKEGYELYPMEQILDFKKKEIEQSNGKIKIKEITWRSNLTVLTYELISLNSVN